MWVPTHHFWINLLYIFLLCIITCTLISHRMLSLYTYKCVPTHRHLTQILGAGLSYFLQNITPDYSNKSPTTKVIMVLKVWGETNRMYKYFLQRNWWIYTSTQYSPKESKMLLVVPSYSRLAYIFRYQLFFSLTKL